LSGIFIKQEWHDTTGRICGKCKSPVWRSGGSEESFQCLNCGKVLKKFETEDQDPSYRPRITVARRAGGITIITALEFLLDDNENPIVFESQSDAEKLLLDAGYESEDLGHMYFIEVDNEPKT